jgi:small subunit ribosomal protein S16
MPAKIRLTRHGKKSRPFYYVVVADSRAPRDGKFIERIGSYNPVTNPATIELDFDKALSWLQKGALPTDTVRSILHQKGVLYKNHLLKGIVKGALNEEQAEKKFQEWMEQNEAKIKNLASELESDKRNRKKELLAEETKVKEARAAALAKKLAKEAAAAHAADETPAEELAETPAETPAEAPAEAPDAPAAEAPEAE